MSAPPTPVAPTFFATPAKFRAWLKRNAASKTELLVGFHKVDSGLPSMSWPESVDEALCVGWIDGVRKRIDDQSYTIRFTPRKPGSIWSAINIAKVAQLTKEGRMTAPGLEAFGRRTEARSVVYAYEQADPAALTPDEETAFRDDAEAWRYYLAAPPGYRKTLLHWITSARKPATRAQRLDKLIKACAAGLRL